MAEAVIVRFGLITVFGERFPVEGRMIGSMGVPSVFEV